MRGSRYNFEAPVYCIFMTRVKEPILPFDEEVIPSDLPTHQRRSRKDVESVRQTIRQAILESDYIDTSPSSLEVGDLSEITYEESVESGYHKSFADPDLQDEYDSKQLLMDEKERADIRRQHDIVHVHIFKGLPKELWLNRVIDFPLHVAMLPRKGDRLTIDGVELRRFRKYPKVKHVVRHLGTDLGYVSNPNDFVDVFIII